MDLNATLLGEMLTFAILVWITMRYIWPPINKALQERQDKIAAGLTAAEQGKRTLELSKTHASQTLRDAKDEAIGIIAHAKEQASAAVHAGRVLAERERETILEQAKSDVERELDSAQHVLQQHTADLVISVLTRILPRQVDSAVQKELIEQLIRQVEQ